MEKLYLYYPTYLKTRMRRLISFDLNHIELLILYKTLQENVHVENNIFIFQ